ncbi:hypothetical protein BH11PSE3_BH11PSE3_42300 [soil metagenome]
MVLIDPKRALRIVMSAIRAALPEGERRAAAAGLVNMMLREKPFGTPAIVSGFWPIKDEIDIRPLMAELSSQGCQLALPVVQARGRPLLFRAWRLGEPLEAGVFGTLQPSAQSAVLEPDALIVPLLACDEAGWRLGYGGGFYDRTLALLRTRRKVTAVGVGFNAQLIAAVPHGPEDQPLDWLLTDKRACAFV